MATPYDFPCLVARYNLAQRRIGSHAPGPANQQGQDCDGQNHCQPDA
jgi:hypothetical protein